MEIIITFSYAVWIFCYFWCNAYFVSFKSNQKKFAFSIAAAVQYLQLSTLLKKFAYCNLTHHLHVGCFINRIWSQMFCVLAQFIRNFKMLSLRNNFDVYQIYLDTRDNVLAVHKFFLFKNMFSSSFSLKKIRQVVYFVFRKNLGLVFTLLLFGFSSLFFMYTLLLV